MKYEEVELENWDCPLCGSENYKKLFNASDKISNLPGIFTVVKCNKCDLVRTNPRPTPQSIGFYYPDDYAPYLDTDKDESNVVPNHKGFVKKILEKLFGGLDDKVHVLPENFMPTKVLEIGCASGSYMTMLRAKGWDVEGIEFSPSSAQKARDKGFEVFTGSVEDAAEPKVKYDLVVGWMVLEHLYDPKGVLKKLNSWTNYNGKIVLSVPNINNMMFKVFKQNDFGLHLPNHLTHYSPKTIEKILFESGWTVDKIIQQRTLGAIFMSLGLILLEKNKKITYSFL